MVATATYWQMFSYSDSKTYKCIDPSTAVVLCDIKSLNKAKVACASTVPIDVGSIVVVQEVITDALTGAVLETHDLLYGDVIKYTQRSKGIVNNVYDYEVTEKAVELEKFRIHTTGANYTVNLPSQSLGADVAAVLFESGWTIDGSPPSANILEPIQLKLMTGLAGLNKLISEMGAATTETQYYMWFDALHGGSKTVGWGTIKNDNTSLNFTKGIYYGYEEYVTKIAMVDGVIIYGAGMTSVGQYPPTITGHKIAVYQYDDATSNAECITLAGRVYLDYCKDPRRRIQFKVDPRRLNLGTAFSPNYITEGDLISVDGVSYPVTDMTLSAKEVQVGVNAGQTSIIYALGDRLKPIAGGTSGQIDSSWSPGQQNVAGDNVTWTKFSFPVADITYLGATVSMLIGLAAYRAYSYQGATPVANELLSEITTPAYHSASADESYACTPGSDVYVPIVGTGPTPYLVAPTMSGGFQFAIASLSTYGLMAGTGSTNIPAEIYIACQYSYNGATPWYEGSHIQRIIIPSWVLIDGVIYDQIVPITNTYMIPGIATTSQLYARWRVHYEGATTNRPFYIHCSSIALDVMPRHTHVFYQENAATTNTVQGHQLDDIQDKAATPSSILCQVNSGSEFSVSNAGVYDIKGDLATGDNVVRFRSPTPCMVTPSATFKMFPS